MLRAGDAPVTSQSRDNDVMALKIERTAQKKVGPAWRTVCQQHALKQATLEAHNAWHVTAKAIPFNHRWEHVQTVVTLALRLAAETGADAEVVEAAAWLHDVRKGAPSHGVAGAKTAKKILEQTDFPREKIAAVAEAIAHHVGLYRAPDAAPLEPVETAILWDADKLSKLGVQAIAYNLSMSYMHGLSLAQRRSNMLEFTHSVLVRTVASMNTAPAQQMAAERYQAMLMVLTAWEHEEDPGNGEATEAK
jgi:uncharacterized protein